MVLQGIKETTNDIDITVNDDTYNYFYESDLKIENYKEKDIYLEIEYITKDNMKENEKIKLFFA